MAELETKLQVAADRACCLPGPIPRQKWEGKISTEAIALILAHPGEPIFCETTQNNESTGCGKEWINLQQNT